MNSPHIDNNQEYSYPMSPIGSAKSMEKLFQGKIVINSNQDFYPQEEESQMQFYIGAEKRQELFKQKNEINQPNNEYSESNINFPSLYNLEQNNMNNNMQKKINSSVVSSTVKNYNSIICFDQSPISENVGSRNQKRIDFNNNKYLDHDLVLDQSSSLVNSSEMKQLRFHKRQTEEDMNAQRLQQSVNSGNRTISKIIYTNDSKLAGINDSILQDSVNEQGEIAAKINIYKHMRVINYVKIFINKMKALSLLINYNLMRKQHIQIINDTACFLHQQTKQSDLNQSHHIYHIKSFLCFFMRFFRCIPVINPENQWCILWDVIYGFILLFYFFIIPLELGFDVDFQLLFTYFYYYFICNMFIQFCKGFYHKGTLVMNRKKIILNYLKCYFLLDVIILISILTQFQIWIGFLKYPQLKQIIQRADDHFQIVRRFPILYEVAHLLITIVLIGQIAGCGFHFIAKESRKHNHNAETWLNILELQDLDWEERYIASIYFAFITMITVGYGDIYPINKEERMYVIVMTLLSSAVFGYVMNTIGYIFQSQAQKQATFKKRKQDITNFLNYRKISRQLQMKILKYIDYQEKTQKNHDLNQDILFKDVPSNLTEEIYQQYYGQFLLQNKIMRLNFSNEILMTLSVMMKELYLAPNEYLLREGSRVTCIYFLIEGELDFLWPKKIKEGIALSAINQIGEALGMRCAFSKKKIKYSIKSAKNEATKLIYFEMDNFISVLQNFPKDYEKFCELRDEIVFNSYSLDTKCYSCNRFNHIFEDCPLLNIRVRQRSLIIAKHTYPFKQERSYKKRNYNKFNTLKKKDYMIDSIAHMRIKMFLEAYPELVDNAQQLYDLDLATLFLQIPHFGYIDGSYQVDQEENSQDIDSDGDLGSTSHKSGRKKDDVQSFVKKTKSFVPTEDLTPLNPSTYNSTSPQNNNLNNIPENPCSLNSLQMQSMSQIIDPQQIPSIQQSQLQSQLQLQQQHQQQQQQQQQSTFIITSKLQQVSDQMTLKGKNKSGSSIQNQSEISLNQPECFNCFHKEQNQQTQNGLSFIPELLSKNSIISSPHFKKKDNLSLKSQRLNTPMNPMNVRLKQVSQMNGIRDNANQQDGRKCTYKKSTTIIGNGNQDLKMMLLINEKNSDAIFVDFDKMKNFQKYYPRCNSKNIIERYNFIQKRIITKPKRNNNQLRQQAIYGINQKKHSTSRQSQFYMNNLIKISK